MFLLHSSWEHFYLPQTGVCLQSYFKKVRVLAVATCSALLLRKALSSSGGNSCLICRQRIHPVHMPTDQKWEGYQVFKWLQYSIFVQIARFLAIFFLLSEHLAEGKAMVGLQALMDWKVPWTLLRWELQSDIWSVSSTSLANDTGIVSIFYLLPFHYILSTFEGINCGVQRLPNIVLLSPKIFSHSMLPPHLLFCGCFWRHPSTPLPLIYLLLHTPKLCSNDLISFLLFLFLQEDYVCGWVWEWYMHTCFYIGLPQRNVL